MNKSRKIIIDTNLLVLLVIGLTDRKLIEKHKRTKKFEIEDFKLLTNILSGYDEIVVTPHILTETSNLVSQIGNPNLTAIRRTFSKLFSTQNERYEPSIEIGKHESFVRLGLTDCAILNLVKEKIPLITVDLDLYLSASNINHETLNFNHLRQSRLLNI